jgi:polar amino acid transport system permease protein
MTYNWDFHAVWQYWDLFLWGLWITIIYTFGSILFGVVIGFLTCAARLSGLWGVNAIARIYQEIFRCTPLLVQLLWFYYAFPLLVGASIDNRVAALLTLSLYVGAFYAEIFRGGIVSIDKGQHEAAAAIGMSSWQSMYRIILPQAMKRSCRPSSTSPLSSSRTHLSCRSSRWRTSPTWRLWSTGKRTGRSNPTL